MNAPPGHVQVRALHATRQRVAQLLSHYPELTDEDVAEIVEFLRTGRHLDIGLLTADDELRPKLDAFMHEHKQQLQPKVGEIAAVVTLITAFLIVCGFVWSLY